MSLTSFSYFSKTGVSLSLPPLDFSKKTYNLPSTSLKLLTHNLEISFLLEPVAIEIVKTSLYFPSLVIYLSFFVSFRLLVT